MGSNPAVLAQAVALLQQGELVAFPTETVYGLGADGSNPAAVAKIFAAKGRPADHPLIIHLPGAAWMEQWAKEIPDVAWELAEDFWPGPLTLILKKQDWVPDAVTGGQDTVGLRVPGHPVALELLRAFAQVDPRGGLAAPSANRFGRISPTTALHVQEELAGRVALIVDGGACQVGIESTIVDLSRGGGEILRPGHISPAQLLEVLGDGFAPGVDRGLEVLEAPRVSGSLASHYAPSTPVQLVGDLDGPGRLADAVAMAVAGVQAEAGRVVRCGVLSYRARPEMVLPREWRCEWHLVPADPAGYARALYGALRALDHQGLDVIVVESPPETPAWAAVWDRLRRAAYRE